MFKSVLLAPKRWSIKYYPVQSNSFVYRLGYLTKPIAQLSLKYYQESTVSPPITDVRYMKHENPSFQSRMFTTDVLSVIGNRLKGLV